ncbi:MAG: hypothetical protein ACOC1D_03605 [Prolixibacteraceae bacterium]
MNAIVHRITESNLSDFKGLSVEGQIPVSEEILNDMIRMFMEDMQKPKAEKEKPAEEPAQQPEPSSQEESIDINKILSALDEKDVKIELKEKQAVIKVTVRKY